MQKKKITILHSGYVDALASSYISINFHRVFLFKVKKISFTTSKYLIMHSFLNQFIRQLQHKI